MDDYSVLFEDIRRCVDRGTAEAMIATVEKHAADVDLKGDLLDICDDLASLAVVLADEGLRARVEKVAGSLREETPAT